MTGAIIVSVAAVECALVDAPWSFAVDQAEAIERHWRNRTAEKPELFNGRILVLHHGTLAADSEGRPVFRGACIEAEFKAFMAWREFGFPDTGIRNCFSMAALETADGAFVLGEMGQQNATAGQIYFPAGTPDRSDIFGDVVDIEGSAQRELLEETGLGESDVSFEAGLTLVMDPVRVCCMKRIVSPEPAEALVDRIHGWLARNENPELARMHIIRGTSDITPAMPSFVAAYLRHRLARL